VTADEVIAMTALIIGVAVTLPHLVVSGLQAGTDWKQQRERPLDERHQVRLSDAYITLIRLTDEVGFVFIRLQIGSDAPPARPEAPESDVQMKVMSLMNAFGSAISEVHASGSESIKARMQTWLGSVDAVLQADKPNEMRTAQNDLEAVGEGPARNSLTPSAQLQSPPRPAELEARVALRDQLSLELRTIAEETFQSSPSHQSPSAQ